MTKRLFIRRALLTASITATAATLPGSVLHAENDIIQVEYKPGQPGQQTQGNTTVAQELNRMFQESGQPMPSMLQQDLPNANAPIQGKVQPRPGYVQPVQPQHQTVAPRPAPSKTGFMSKLFGKFRRDSVDSNANVQPPVPPGYVPATPGNGVANNGAASPARQQMASQPAQAVPQPPRNSPVQNQNNYNTNQPANPSQHASGNATANAYHGNRPPGGVAQQPQGDFKNGAMSPVPPRSGATVQPLPYASSSGNNSSPAYAQPGSAPGFMAKSGNSAVMPTQPVPAPPSGDRYRQDFERDNTLPVANNVPVANTVKPAKTPAPVLGAAAMRTNDDGFDSPFVDSSDSADPSEMLDLDSLIEIPPAAPEEIQSAALTKDTAQALVPGVSNENQSKTNPGLAAPTANSSALDFETSVVETSEATEPEAAENPFTGVQLNATDAEFFGDQEPVATTTGNSSNAAGMPIEDFDPNLPAMDLPPIDDLDSSEDVADDSDDPSGLVQTPTQEPEPSVKTAARAKLPDANVPATMSAAETERLRQTAEQDRRSNQLRLIQSRAGQYGFKGFCPVALRERRELVNADPLYASTFGLQTYTFSSAEAKASFDTDPSRYAPAAGGSDVVVLVNSGEEQAGQLDFALWYRDRLYLFRSRETMTLFSKDPQRFASQY